MTCTNGRVNPSAVTKLRLFADSGGYCSNPSCLTEIFVDLQTRSIHVGEIAHVISAGADGPRAAADEAPADLARHENLILLCPRCHTIIDKAEEEFPVELILRWKGEHKHVIAAAFGVAQFPTREAARAALRGFLDENSFIFREYGPMSDERFNPESEMPEQWIRKVRTKIIPNNRKILSMCDANIELLSPDERGLLLSFRQHVDDFEAKHLLGAEQNGRQFPEGFNAIFT